MKLPSYFEPASSIWYSNPIIRERNRPHIISVLSSVQMQTRAQYALRYCATSVNTDNTECVRYVRYDSSMKFMALCTYIACSAFPPPSYCNCYWETPLLFEYHLRRKLVITLSLKRRSGYVWRDTVSTRGHANNYVTYLFVTLHICRIFCCRCIWIEQKYVVWCAKYMHCNLQKLYSRIYLQSVKSKR
jgi:hypothetical protein